MVIIILTHYFLRRIAPQIHFDKLTTFYSRLIVSKCTQFVGKVLELWFFLFSFSVFNIFNKCIIHTTLYLHLERCLALLTHSYYQLFCMKSWINPRIYLIDHQFLQYNLQIFQLLFFKRVPLGFTLNFFFSKYCQRWS